MRDDVRRALAIDRSSTIQARTIDITTTGRRSWLPRRIEICLYRFEDSVYLSGIPGARTRDWLANLVAAPASMFTSSTASSPIFPRLAAVITDPVERRRLFSELSTSSTTATAPAAPARPPSWTNGSSTVP